MKSYKKAVENIFKDIKANVGTPMLAEFKTDKRSTTRKELFARLTRQLMLHFTCYIEIVTVGEF